MLGKKKLAIKFEESVKDFLDNLEFEDVDGARDTFKIDDIQVDVCGGFDGTLLIIECCMATELKKKSVKKKIINLRGVSQTLKKGIRKHPTYRKYENIRYVLATKNIEVKRDDIKFANKEDPRVYIWDENFRKYYEDLFGKIGEYAKFNLLGEMGIRPSQINPISVPAFMTSMGKTRIFNFVMNPKDLLEISYVARRETRNERYYQRILRKKRLRLIADYINDGNILPNNLIIAFNEKLRRFVNFHAIKKGDEYSLTDWPYKGISYGILEFPKDYRSCWIIDGQHRLYSFVSSKKTFHMPIVAFDNLPLEDQCKIFLDINKYQKPVPPDLVWDLNGEMISTQEDGIISNTVKSLNSFGPLHHKIYIPSTGIKSRRKLLRISGICLSIKNAGLARPTTISKVANPFYDDEPEKLVKKLSESLNSYLECVKNKLRDNWDRGNKGFVLANAGNAVMVGLFEKIVRKVVLSENKTPDAFDYIRYIEPLKKLFEERFNTENALKQLRLRITSEGGKRQFLGELVGYIAQQTGDGEFAAGIESPFSKNIRELERKLKELIRISLSKGETGDWFKEKMKAVDPAIYGRALKNMKKHHITDYNKAYLQLTFGDCVAVIKSKYNNFKQVFVSSEKGFTDRTHFEGALNHINRIRTTQYAHDIGVSLKPHDWELFDIYMRIMTNCLNSVLKKAT